MKDSLPAQIPNTPLLAACSVALGSLVPVALYQLHIIDRLPDPPGSLFDSGRITASKTAHPLGIPDSLPGLGSYSVTLVLIFNAARGPRWRRALAAKLALDGAAATFNFTRQIITFRRLCSWCTLTAAATAAMVYAARPLLSETARELAEAADPAAEESLPVLDALSPEN